MVSHYGWAIMVSLVISVMIAFATPLGRNLGRGALNIAESFFGVGEEAASEKNLNNKEAVWENKFDEKYTRFQSHTGTIPKKGEYYVNATTSGLTTITASTHKYSEGEEFPTPQTGDIYKYRDYIYRYNYINNHNSWQQKDIGGWSIATVEKKGAYKLPLESIAGQNVVNARRLFYNNNELQTAPELPDSITDMCSAFYGCTALVSVPSIPKNTTDLSNTFAYCTSLTKSPELPNSITNMGSTFNGCTSLITPPKIPETVTNMSQTFYNCTSLSTAPTIPENVTNMYQTFINCSSLVTTPTFLNNAISDLPYTFENCTSLTSVAVLPTKVKSLSSTFRGCTSLQTVSATIPGSVKVMNNTFEGCKSLTGTIKINAIKLDNYENAFANTEKPIKLTGDSNYRSHLAGTANNHNITVA